MFINIPYILPVLQPTFPTTRSYYLFSTNSVSNYTPNKKDTKLVSTQKAKAKQMK